MEKNGQQELDDLEAAFRGRSGDLLSAIGSMLRDSYGIFGYWITEVTFISENESRPEFVSHHCIKTPDGGYRCGIYGLSTAIRAYDEQKAHLEEPEQVTRIFREAGEAILSDMTALVEEVLSHSGLGGYRVTHVTLGTQRPGSAFYVCLDGGFKAGFCIV